MTRRRRPKSSPIRRADEPQGYVLQLNKPTPVPKSTHSGSHLGLLDVMELGEDKRPNAMQTRFRGVRVAAHERRAANFWTYKLENNYGAVSRIPTSKECPTPLQCANFLLYKLASPQSLLFENDDSSAEPERFATFHLPAAIVDIAAAAFFACLGKYTVPTSVFHPV